MTPISIIAKESKHVALRQKRISKALAWLAEQSDSDGLDGDYSADLSEADLSRGVNDILSGKDPLAKDAPRSYD